MDEKKDVMRFFDYVYANMYEFVQSDNGCNAKNQECFEKAYLAMIEAFENTEDSCHIDWKHMWDFLALSEIMDSSLKDEKAEDSQKSFEKYKDIDMFFGILHQCMMTTSSYIMNESNQKFIKNAFEKTKEKFKKPGYANRIPWDRMWQMLMNSGVYAKVVKEMRENNGYYYLEKKLYSGDESFLLKLMHEDSMENKTYSRFVCVLKSDYIGFDVSNSIGTEKTKWLKSRFGEIIKKLDHEQQIERIFAYCEKGKKIPIWEVSAVDARAFYLKIDEEGYFGTLGYKAAATLYAQFCNDDGWKKGYKRIEKLIECFEKKKDCHICWYEEYKLFDIAAKILCDLVPVVYHGENGERQIKTYSRWREECGKIMRIVHQKALTKEIDQAEVKAAELAGGYINMISDDRRYEKEVGACMKERYLEYLVEQSEKFFQASERVYGALENVDNKKDRAEIAKKALDSLDMNL